MESDSGVFGAKRTHFEKFILNTECAFILAVIVIYLDQIIWCPVLYLDYACNKCKGKLLEINKI